MHTRTTGRALICWTCRRMSLGRRQRVLGAAVFAASRVSEASLTLYCNAEKRGWRMAARGGGFSQKAGCYSVISCFCSGSFTVMWMLSSCCLVVCCFRPVCWVPVQRKAQPMVQRIITMGRRSRMRERLRIEGSSLYGLDVHGWGLRHL
jgi:hypothetical protein